MPRPIGFRASLAVLLTLALSRPLAAAPRLDYRGTVLSQAQVQSAASPWLRAPADSAAGAGALAEIVRRLEELGYLEARARGWRDTLGGDRLVIQVTEGTRRRLAAIEVHGASTADSAALHSALPLTAGHWVSPREVNDALESALGTVADHGYPYAEFDISSWRVDSTGVRLGLEAARGPLVTVSKVEIDGLHATREDFATRAMGRLTGLPYRRAAAEAARDRLAQLGLFRSVRYLGLRGEGDWSAGRLVYRVEEPRYNSFEGAMGVQGDAGVAGLARLELGNLLGTGRTLRMRWESRGHGHAEFDLGAVEPLLFGAPLRLEGRLLQQLQDTLYTRTLWGARAGFALSAQERLDIGFEGERIVQSSGPIEQAWLQNTVFGLERNTLDDPFAPRRGTRARLGATQVFKRERLRPLASQSARASAVESSYEVHLPTGPAAGVALELAVAGRFSSQRVLPIFERYPLGGATTLRGFDEAEFRVDRYARSRLEWQWFLGGRGQRTALFWDHGWTGTRLANPDGGDHFEVLHHDGLGFGLRLEAAGGLIGVDYGLQPGRGALEGKIHLQLVSTF